MSKKNQPEYDPRHESREPEESLASRLGRAAAEVIIGAGALVMLT